MVTKKSLFATVKRISLMVFAPVFIILYLLKRILKGKKNRFLFAAKAEKKRFIFDSSPSVIPFNLHFCQFPVQISTGLKGPDKKANNYYFCMSQSLSLNFIEGLQVRAKSMYKDSCIRTLT